MNYAKTCKVCQRRWEPEAARLLELRGPLPDSDPPYDVRQCVCGNTLAVEADPALTYKDGWIDALRWALSLDEADVDRPLTDNQQKIAGAVNILLR